MLKKSEGGVMIANMLQGLAMTWLEGAATSAFVALTEQRLSERLDDVTILMDCKIRESA